MKPGFFELQSHESRLPTFRRLCNLAKAKLLEEALAARCRALPLIYALDLGCGRGGDLLKWCRDRPKRIAFVDASAACLAEARRRVATAVGSGRCNVSGSFHQLDARTDRLPAADGSLDVISCQFALQHMADSEQHLLHVIAEAARCIAPGGVFVITYPDGDRVRHLLRSGREAGHFLLDPRLPDYEDPPPVGAPYAFRLFGPTPCEEYIISERFLCAAAQAAGFCVELCQGAQAFLSRHGPQAEQRDWDSVALFRVAIWRRQSEQGSSSLGCGSSALQSERDASVSQPSSGLQSSEALEAEELEDAAGSAPLKAQARLSPPPREAAASSITASHSSDVIMRRAPACQRRGTAGRGTKTSGTGESRSARKQEPAEGSEAKR